MPRDGHLPDPFFTAAELAAMTLPGMPTTRQGVQLLADRGGWAAPERQGAAWRMRAGRGGGVEFHHAVLPLAAQAALLLRLRGQAPAAPATPGTAERWAWYERQTARTKARAAARLEVVASIHALLDSGTGKMKAIETVSELPDTLTDLERAARFLYLQRAAYGGKVMGRHFGVSPGMAGRFDTAKLGPVLEAVHERLSGVVIECLPWRELLPRYDRPSTLWYLDPPYWGNETDYGEGVFGRSDFTALAEALALLRGTWVLSLNDTPGVREVFARFAIEAVETTYSIAGGRHNAVRRGEVLITPC